VIEGICTAAQGEEIAASLRKTLAAVGGSKWKTTLPRSKGMLLEPNAVAHCDAAWRARLACLPAFAALFGTGDLLCSFDRFNVMVRGDEVPPWLHTDQSGKLEGQQCIQGYLDVNGTGPDDAGLVVCERSHLAHLEMLTKWGALRDSHWYLLKKSESATARERFVTKKVQCAPGSLVLWDSRTLHENTAHTPHTKGRDRLVFYVCMLPRSVAHAAGERRYAELLEAKRAAFTGRMATTHWPVLCNKFEDAHKNEYRLTNQDIRQPAPEGAIASLAGFTEQPALEYAGEAHVSILNPEKIYYYSV
jgi:hypothetical protein